jgi:hypothetical protein
VCAKRSPSRGQYRVMNMNWLSLGMNFAIATKYFKWLNRFHVSAPCLYQNQRRGFGKGHLGPTQQLQRTQRMATRRQNYSHRCSDVATLVVSPSPFIVSNGDASDSWCL